jgi:tetratricopeptide (TPR) repeat protein
MKKLTHLLILPVIALLTLAVYANHFHNSFHFDDVHTISNNLDIRSLHNIPRFFTDATTMSTQPSNQSYRPLLTTSMAVDFYLSGKPAPDPFVFHITNFVFFLLLGFLCYYLFVHLLQASMPSSLNKYIALFTTAWLLLHAANAETVNYIIARSDIMSTFFMVAGFVAYCYSPVCRKYYLYLVPVLLGLLTKEHTIMFVPILFFYTLFFEQQAGAADWKKKTAGIIAAAKTMILPFALTLIVFWIVRTMTSHTWTPGGTDRWKYIFSQPFVIFHYWYNFLLPSNLVVDTDWTVVSSYTDDRVFAGLLFIAALVLLFVISSNRQSSRPVAFGIAWFLLALAPTSLMPFAEVLNDHRTFFAYIGLFIASATLIRNFLHTRNLAGNTPWKWSAIILGIVFLSLHAMATRERNKVWATEKSLWQEATIKAPANGRCWMNYGVTLMAEGNFAAAEACFIKTTQLWPTYSFAYANLGVAQQYTGHPVEAEQYFKKALALDANVPVIYELYAKLLEKQGRLAEAAPLIKKGLALSPNLEGLLQLQTTHQAAWAALSQKPAVQAPVTTKTPTAESLIDASLQYYNTGAYVQCIEAAEAALKIKPGYDLAYNNICAANNRLQQYDKAIAAGEKGLTFNPNNQLLKGNLAEAYREKNK